MIRYLARRVVRSVLTIWIVVTLVFIAFRLLGDPIDALLPGNAPESIRQFYIEQWGLDASLAEQYIRYFAALTQGNLGQSFVNGLPVSLIIAEAVPNTLLLGGLALIISIVAGGTAGILAALWHRRWQDRLVTVLSVTTYALPDYLLGTMLIILFAVELRLLPTSGTGTPSHLILPLITLSSTATGRIARFTRGALLEVLREPYLRTAHAKGLFAHTVLWRHALRNAAIPVIAILGIQVGFLVAGATVVETVFAIPGVGRLFVSAVSARDLPVVQAVVILIAFGVTTANLIADLLYPLIDPRIRLSGTGGSKK